jgi:hypothetical protein
MKTLLVALIAACCLCACDQSSSSQPSAPQAPAAPDGYAISCDNLGHLSVVRLYADGTVSHSEDISYQVQDCRTMQDGTTVLSKPGVKFAPLGAASATQ